MGNLSFEHSGAVWVTSCYREFDLHLNFISPYKYGVSGPHEQQIMHPEYECRRARASTGKAAGKSNGGGVS